MSGYADELGISDLQFGFKCQRLTNMCTMVLKEALPYYVHNGKSVFCTLLDVTKAFDRMEYVTLFTLLIHRDIPPVSLRFLLHMYPAMLHTWIAWNGMCSESVSVFH